MTIKTDSLTKETLRVIKNKGTEAPYSGEFNDFEASGTYLCRQCGLALFRSETKFHSGCGWPSFDEEIPNTVLREKDKDGVRIEILCARCRAHLGHEFANEGYTPKNIRQCVNSLSLDFVSSKTVLDTEEAILAAGCFWGVEYYLKHLPGVLKTEVGYTGGNKENPTYDEICQGNTGHLEAIRVLYDPKQISYEAVVKYFFEIHDPTQSNGQGPDHGAQYLSAIFYYDEKQKNIASELIDQLKKKSYSVVTRLIPVATFWRAETYHQEYYEKNKKTPYCHRYEKKF